MNLTVAYIVPFAMALPVVGIAFKFDPTLYLFQDTGISSHVPFALELLMRWTICTLAAVETARTFCIFLIASLLIYIVTFRTLETLRQLSVFESIELYRQLMIIHNNGNSLLVYSVCLFLTGGFFLCVIFSGFTIVGWRVFPLPFYFTCMPITFFIYFLIHVGIPLCVRCHESSFDTIKFKWPSDIGHSKEEFHFQRKLIRRKLWALKPITFESGSVATLDRETRLNYLEHILEKTTDILMVFQKQIERLDKIEF